MSAYSSPFFSLGLQPALNEFLLYGSSPLDVFETRRRASPVGARNPRRWVKPRKPAAVLKRRKANKVARKARRQARR